VFARATESRSAKRYEKVKKMMRSVILVTVTGSIIVSGQERPQTPGQPGGAGRGGQADAQAGPPAASASVRPSGASLGTIRLGAADDRIWFGWFVGIPASAFRQLTFSEAAARADALGLGSIEGFSAQKVSPEVPKNLDYNLAPGELKAIANRLRELNVQMRAYHVDSIGVDDDARRKLFEFAKGLGVQTIIVAAQPASLADIDRVANEFGINVALENRRDPKIVLSALEGRSQRIGICADIGGWMQEGIKPLDGLSLVKDRMMVVKLRDRSALGPGGRDVTAGSGAAGLGDFFLAAFRLKLKPLFIVVDTTGAADAYADLAASLKGWEKSMQAAMTARVAQVVDSPAGAIRGPDRLSPEMRQQIDAAAPRQAIAKPKKPRKLLVTDLQMYSGHSTIPHGNLMLELMAKYTGAFEPLFSNDLNNLKYPKIKEFDAVFLNNVCGMVFPDPEVREGLLRFIREGGGLGGNHAVTYANLDWPEFTEMLGGWAGAHRVEKKVLKIDDPNSPLTAMFGGRGFEHTDEFYHFPASSPYSREKQRVLLSIDVDKSDMATSGRFCVECTRPDHDYGMSWIKSYGKGRVYCTPLGHTTILYTSQQWVQHMLAAVQFILGDLDADTTPSARRAGQRQK
jgi:type 1 glutamine amidotransferase/sugar phosphate isomerase/epimerase